MERFNPFANSSITDDPDPFTTNFNRSSQSTTLGRQTTARTDSIGSGSGRYGIATSAAAVVGTSSSSPASSPLTLPPSTPPTTANTATSRYTTSFPDPFGDNEEPVIVSTGIVVAAVAAATTTTTTKQASGSASGGSNPRSNSVTFAPISHSVDDPVSVASPTRAGGRQASGFTSFLSRATSVTSSSVTDRVSGAVGSVRSAVDSISSQIQQAVPSNLNERLSSTATNLIGSSGGDQSQQQQQSAASYLASKISSATGQFTSSGPSSGSLPVISRQRVILILDNYVSTDWAQQFNNYRRLTTGLPPVSQSALTSFFSSATAQLTSSSSPLICDGVDLVEQADFRDVSVLANQTSSTATIYVTNNSTVRSSTNTRSATSVKIIRPEYVVIRQRTKDRLNHLRGIATALNYCLVPMFEPIEVWNSFQDRQLIFSKLLRVQKTLGKENFPLIPQVYCQTHQDLLNYINSSSVKLPCLARVGPLGKGKIRIDNLQMIKDFASIMATSGLSCTIEQYLDVKCDLIVQKLGTSLKLFKRNATQRMDGIGGDVSSLNERSSSFSNLIANSRQDQQTFTRQSATRQTSIGSSVLSSLIPSSGQQQQHQQGQQHQQHQQLDRRNSKPDSTYSAFEKMSEVNVRYRNWVESIMREFDNKIEAFCIKIVVTESDREYIVGLGDCSMDFMGNSENQDEDRRSFVELIISNMNTILPKGFLSRESSSSNTAASGIIRRRSSEEKAASANSTIQSSSGYHHQPPLDSLTGQTPLGDKKKFISQTQINGACPMNKDGVAGRGYGQLSSRSQSVSVNQSDYLANDQAINKSAYFVRRGSDRTDSLTNDTDADLSYNNNSTRDSQAISGSNSSSIHQRQASLGQSLFDQTSTAFSSFQKQSLSFFKRLDARAGDVSNTPPQSARSDKGFDRAFDISTNISSDNIIAGGRNGFKSQSVDSSTLDNSKLGRPPRRRETPPKPPPPSMGARQSSLASSYATQRASSSAATPQSTPVQTRQNSAISDSEESRDQSRIRGKVVRQNSALSAFEPFDPELAAQLRAQKDPVDPLAKPISTNTTSIGQTPTMASEIHQKSIELAKRGTNFDSASVTSGDSNSTSETTTAEDTMNNLKKTFASIFGDKCE